MSLVPSWLKSPIPSSWKVLGSTATTVPFWSVLLLTVRISNVLEAPVSRCIKDVTGAVVVKIAGAVDVPVRADVGDHRCLEIVGVHRLHVHTPTDHAVLQNLRGGAAVEIPGAVDVPVTVRYLDNERAALDLKVVNEQRFERPCGTCVAMYKDIT